MRRTLAGSLDTVRRLWAHRTTRFVRAGARWTVALLAVILAVAIVTTFTIDLGPSARGAAERYASQYLKRPMHIGRLSFRLWTGRFLLEDLVIEGLTSESRPFLRAKRLEVAIPWSTLFDRRFVLDSIEMTDWDMHLEVLPNGRHSLPRLTPDGPRRERRSGWTTTLRYVRAHRGTFTFEDHGTPWSIVTRNLDVIVARPGSEYRGQARFSNGTIAIQDYRPFGAEMAATFEIDGTRVVLDRIDLTTDGARSHVYGDVNLAHFPEMMYRVESEIDFARMRQIFFAREPFRLTGTGRFAGHFHLFKEQRPDGTSRTGRELFGTFESAVAGVNEYRFPNLRGSVRWTPERLAVTDASADLFGGRAQFRYVMSPLGTRGVRPTARFDAGFEGVDLLRVTEFMKLDGMRLSGAAGGRLDLQWPLGRFAAGRQLALALHVTPPDGVSLMTQRVPVELIEQGRLPRAPAAPLAPLIPLPIGADLNLRMTGDRLSFGPSHVATQRTFVAFEGKMGLDGEAATIPFSVSSADWEESYRVFADMMTAFGRPTTAIDIGGYGTFDGMLTQSVRRPRIEGVFAGERMRVWDVEWGAARGRAVIENGYAEVRETTVARDRSTIVVDGRFALGFSPADGGEEINATVRLTDRPVADLRHAFGIDRYPIEGLLSGEFHVFGAYRMPYGYGTMQLTQGEAYGEPFDYATASVGLEGAGVRLTAMEIQKGVGRASGAAYVSWEGTYSFDLASTAPVPVEAIARVRDSMPEGLELTGLIDFQAGGSGSFAAPRFNVTGTVRDLFLNDEGVGQVSVKTLSIADETLALDAEVASPRLAVNVLGTVELTEGMFADLRFAVNQTSLDPYIRAFNPGLSPFTTAVVSGSVNVRGELATPERLAISTNVSDLQLRLFDYELRNSGPFEIAFDRNTIRVPAASAGGADCLARRESQDAPSSVVGLYGLDTKLEICGEVRLSDETMGVSIVGLANLAVLQGFVDNVASSGTASLRASLTGPLRDPVVSGTLAIENGRIRHFDLPLALERISGDVAFTEGGVTLDGLSAELGGGRVQFEGTIEKDGYLPGQINVSMSSIGNRGVLVRYPAGMRSEVGIERLTLRGTTDDLRLDGEVRVLNALYSQPFPTSLFALVAGEDEVAAPPPGTPRLRLTYEGVIIRADSSIRVANTGDISARLTASANLELRGTYEQPVLAGDMEVDRGGEITFLGNRYSVTQGTIYFNNPDRIEPTVDLEVETRVRVPGETYRVTANIRGTPPSRLDTLTLSSDPPLSEPDIWALLISNVPPGRDAELRQARGDSTTRQQALQEAAARLATLDVTSQVNQAFEENFGVGVTIRPTLVDPNLQSSRLEPGARLTLFRQLSPRAYLTYSRSLAGTSTDELILLEYNVTDRTTVSLSRNEDQTYAIEIRVRRAFE